MASAHQNHPHHHHGHTHAHSHAQSNEEYFDKLGGTILDSEEAKVYAKRYTETMLESHQFGKDDDVLDFACGIGSVSLNLAPHVKSITGVDISQKMVDRYNGTASSEGLGDKMRAVKVDITSEEHELKDRKFDAIVCAMSYHHMTNITQTTSSLSSLLKPNGALVIVDFLSESLPREPAPLPEDINAAIAHKEGFTENDMKSAFEGGGLVMKVFKEAFRFQFRMMDMDRMLFVAVGVKE